MPATFEALETRRLLAFADVVTSWGKNGVVDNVKVLAQQSDGKLLGAGAAYDATTLIRLNADGSYDKSFSRDGQVTLAAGVDTVRQITGGKIVVAYHYFRHNKANEDDLIFGYGVARFTANGEVDPTFGNNGSIAAAFRESRIGEFPHFGGAAIDADGSTYFGVSSNYVYVLGHVTTTSSFVLKFNAKGQRDASYGTNGVYALPSQLIPDAKNDFVRTIDGLDLTEGGGPLLVSGTEHRFNDPTDNEHYNDGTAAASYVSRVTAEGKIDTMFATAGTYKIDKTILINGDDDTESAKVVRLRSGHVLLVTRISGRLRVLTLNARGKLITSLSGEQPESVVEFNDSIQFAKALPSGNLIVEAGSYNLFELRSTDHGYVAQAPRLPSDADGKPRTSAFYYPEAMVPLRDGSVIVTGYYDATKISTGDGLTPREDDIPFARQNSITTPGEADDDDYINIPQLDAFFHDSRGGLKYRQRNTAGRWGAVETVDPSPNAGTYLSSAGNLVVYTDGTTADLKCAKRRRDGTWQIRTIDSGGATGLYCSLVRTTPESNYGEPPPAETYAVAYYDRTRGDLRLAQRDSAGKWTTSTVESTGNVGRYAKLSRRLDGRLTIAYATSTTSGVRFAEQRGGKAGGWKFTDLAVNGVDVGGLDMDNFLTNNDPEPAGPSVLTTTVAIFDAKAGDLVIAYRPTETSPFTVVREKSTGTVGLNPHVSHFAEGVVSFYDKTRNQVRTVSVVDDDGTVSPKTDAVPDVASAGQFTNPIVSLADPSIYNSYAGGGYTSTYAWVDDAGVLKVRGPI